MIGKAKEMEEGKDSSLMIFLFKRWVLPKLKNKEFVYDGFNTIFEMSVLRSANRL